MQTERDNLGVDKVTTANIHTGWPALKPGTKNVALRPGRSRNVCFVNWFPKKRVQTGSRDVGP